ncbi:MAG: sulfotransferase domain-containing protein [Roseovarius sp.]
MKRPIGMQGYLKASAKFATTEGVAKGLAFRPDPTDIFVTPYAKCGTTWMQQIVHGLRTGGSMAFSEITEVVPWIELAHDIGLDPEAPQPALPRAYKSHLSWDDIPKGGRYIVVLRDPLDAFLSLYRYMEGWFFETGSVSIDAFATYYLNRPHNESYWGHATSWYGQRGNDTVLLVSFEEMKQNLRPVVAHVARFMGLEADAARVDIATQQASFAFMKAHPAQFDDHLVRQGRDAACGLPPDAEVTKVSTGQVGRGGQMITDEIRAAFERKWSETMGAQFGVKRYEDLTFSLT